MKFDFSLICVYDKRLCMSCKWSSLSKHEHSLYTSS